MTTAALISTDLFPVLAPWGFSDIQGTGDDGQFVFCAALDKIYAVAPELCDAHDPADLGRGGCFDIVVDVSSKRIDSVSVEGPDLADRLRDGGRSAEADAVEAAYREPLSVALPVVAAGLDTLLTVSAGSPG